MRSTATIVAAILAALTACSSSEDRPQQPDASVTTLDTSTEAAETPTSESTSTTEPPTSSDDIVVRPLPASGATGDNSWIGTAVMTDDEIQLVWDLADAVSTAAGNVSHRIYRVPTDQLAENGWASPEEAELTGDDLLYEIPDGVTTFTDSTVETGRFYTYFLVGLTGLANSATDPTEVDPADVDAADVDPANVGVVTRRWTTALAVTDTEPPTAITGLTAEVTDDGVLLSWRPSTDEVEFAAYSVSIVSADGQTVYLGGGADATLTTFLDNQFGDVNGSGPASSGSTIEYVVEAVDYHNNRSEPGRISVTLP